MVENEKKAFRATITLVTNVDAETQEEAQKKALSFLENCVKSEGLMSVLYQAETHELIAGTKIGKKDKNGIDIRIGDTVKTNEGNWTAIVNDIDFISDPYGGYSASCEWEKFEIMPKKEADAYWKKLKDAHDKKEMPK
jgi:hypothetical protein